MERLRFIDGDSHVLEPEAIWEEYLEEKYRHLINGHVRWVRTGQNGGNGANGAAQNGGEKNALAFELELEVMGRRPLGERDPNAATRNFQDRDLDELDTAYGKWADQDFPASAYREVMDVHGVDHMILYPTAGFWTTAVADMDGETAMAIRRAYNRWLGDYCQDIGRGACGAASIDLRDPKAAAEEVRRCVKEYDFQSRAHESGSGAQPTYVRRRMRRSMGNLRRAWRARGTSSQRQPPLRPRLARLLAWPAELPDHGLFRAGEHAGLHRLHYGRRAGAASRSKAGVPRVRMRMGFLLAGQVGSGYPGRNSQVGDSGAQPYSGRVFPAPMLRRRRPGRPWNRAAYQINRRSCHSWGHRLRSSRRPEVLQGQAGLDGPSRCVVGEQA